MSLGVSIRVLVKWLAWCLLGYILQSHMSDQRLTVVAVYDHQLRLDSHLSRLLIILPPFRMSALETAVGGRGHTASATLASKKVYLLQKKLSIYIKFLPHIPLPPPLLLAISKTTVKMLIYIKIISTYKLHEIMSCQRLLFRIFVWLLFLALTFQTGGRNDWLVRETPLSILQL